MIHRTRLPAVRRGPRHAQIHLPPLTGAQALLLCNLLDRAIAAIWRTHGDAMANLLARLDPDTALPTAPETPPSRNDDAPCDEDPF